MGIYARVLFALNLENDITLLAADDAPAWGLFQALG